MGVNRVAQDSGGDDTNYESMKVYICEAKNTSNNQRQMAADGVKQALRELESFGAIPGWQTEQWETSFSLSCDGENLLGEWANYRKNNGMTEEGCWLLVHDCNTSVANSSGNAWEKDLSAIVKVSWAEFCGDNGAFKGVAVQEVFHSFIDSSNCSRVQDYCDGTNEHNLGDEHNPSNSERYRTPMCISYSTAPNGDCNNDVSATDCYGEPILNSCEKKAIRESREHYYGYH